MIGFIRTHVEPADRMAEIVFGLIMALGVTGAIRLAAGDLENRELFVSVLGCNLAWAIVDAVMFVLLRLFNRGRFLRIVTKARAARDERTTEAIVRSEFGSQLVDVMSEEERARFRGLVLGVLNRAEPEPVRLRRGDLLHGIAAGLAVFLPTLPVVAPYLFFSTPLVAVRVSFLIALTLLFLVGVRWGRLVGGRRWRIGAALTLLGITLVCITIALGG